MPEDLRNLGKHFGDVSIDSLTIEQDLIGNIGGTPTWTGEHTFDADAVVTGKFTAQSNVEIPNGNLRLGMERFIQDTDGTERFRVTSGETALYNNAGVRALTLRDDSSVGHRIDAYDGIPVKIRDEMGGFDVLSYEATTSTPGSLMVQNSELKISGQTTLGLATDSDSLGDNGADIREHNDLSTWYTDSEKLGNGWQWRTHSNGDNFARRMKLSHDGSLEINTTSTGPNVRADEPTLDLRRGSNDDSASLKIGNIDGYSLIAGDDNRVLLQTLDSGGNRETRFRVGTNTDNAEVEVRNADLALNDNKILFGSNGITVGDSETSAGSSSHTAVGPGATTSAGDGADQTAIGSGASAENREATAVGVRATVTGSTGAVAVGRDSVASGDNSVAVGRSTDATSADTVAIGLGADATGSNAVAIGRGADAPETDSVALGNGVTANRANTTTVNHLSFNSIGGTIYDANGERAMDVQDGHGRLIHSRDEFVAMLRDDLGDFDAVRYKASSSAPGTLKLTNADLDANENNITNVRSSGDSPVVSGTDYEIQKDGTDGTGIINFKTS